MPQARTLTERELKQLLQYIAYRKHALRNKVMLLCTHWAGMRVGEVAALRYADVRAGDGSIQAELRLSAEQTKGERGRIVYLPEKLRKELFNYTRTFTRNDLSRPLFYTQKRDGWTANTLAQHFHYLYKRAGLDGASSHSGRRTFITRLANMGVGIRVLQALAGHRDLRTTAVYIEANDELKRAAVELI